MQRVLTLRKIFLIFGFALVVFGCDTDNAQLPNANKEVLAAIYSYSANGELSGYYEYEYDSNGNQMKYSDYNANGELHSYSVCFYKNI
ncbi:MAG: hypothetical protein FWF55_02830 [Treponema sp.]|nr:hypothetical protein [Treponema sp.]